MAMKIKVKDLKEAIRRALNEDTADAPLQAGDTTQMQNDSIDAQIDRILLQGDKKQGTQVESFLREDDESDTAADATPTKQIDAVSFADAVARLVEKFDNVIDVKGAVVRRALNYVTKNYDQKQSQTVQQVLLGNFGLEAIDNPGGDDGNADKTPPAKGAGPTGQE